MFTSNVTGGSRGIIGREAPTGITDILGDITGAWFCLKPLLTTNKRSNHVWLWNLLLLASTTAPAELFLGSVIAYTWDKGHFYVHDRTSLTTQKAIVIKIQLAQSHLVTEGSDLYLAFIMFQNVSRWQPMTILNENKPAFNIHVCLRLTIWQTCTHTRARALTALSWARSKQHSLIRAGSWLNIVIQTQINTIPNNLITFI